MSSMRHWLTQAVVVLLLLCFSAVPAQADENFSTSLHTTYSINADGSTRVEHAFAITNKTPTYFISKYGLKVSSGRIAHVAALSNGKSLDPEIVNTFDQTSIGLSFPEESVGEGKTRQFTISYTHPDLAQVTGKVLEVTIPRLSNATDYDTYSVTVKTPERFGQPSRVTPSNYTLTNSPGFIELQPTNNAGQGISAIYGSEQVFELEIEYPLRNEHNQQVITQITLPMDTPYQRLNYSLLEPRPDTIEQDIDGNWIATYTLPPNSSQVVTAKAAALLTLAPNTIVPMPQPLQVHTNPQTFWQSNNDQVQQLAQQHSTPSDIYTYTIETLDYTTKAIEENLDRMGALEALQNPANATCQEFTDLFIAVSRAAGIPARRATGFAYTQNSQLRPLSFLRDILHAWPEYYDSQKQTWIAIDPTWGDTTGGVDYFNQFDLNHIVFAYNGSSSTLPYPAGAYNLTDEPQKNISVSFTDKFLASQPDIALEIEPQSLGAFSLPGMFTLSITNLSGQAWYGITTNITSDRGLVTTKNNYPSALLPFEKKVINFSVSTDDFMLHDAQLLAQVTIQDETFTHANKATTVPAIVYQVQKPQTLTALAGIGIFCTLIAGSILVFRQRKSSAVRRQS